MAKPLDQLNINPTIELMNTTDAVVWANIFAEAFKEVLHTLHPDIDIELDEGWLIGWFANAISTGDQHCYHNRDIGTWVRVEESQGQHLDAIRSQLDYYDTDVRARMVGWLFDEYGKKEPEGETP